MADLPTISIVVPNFNSAGTLGQTLRSLVDQAYPSLEIIVVDGGSTDDSVEIIRQYACHIAWWVSEKDRGQSDAINKGFVRCTGEVVNWLCSDDLLSPGALLRVGQCFADDPQLSVLVGAVEHVFLDGVHKSWRDHPTEQSIKLVGAAVVFSQPSCFYRRSLLDRPGPLDESLYYAMDQDLWAYFKTKDIKWKTIPDVLSIFQISGNNKTAVGGIKVTLELEKVYRRYNHERVPLTFWHRHLRYPLEKWRVRRPGYPDKLLRRPLEVAFTVLFGPFYGFDRVRGMNWSNWA